MERLQQLMRGMGPSGMGGGAGSDAPTPDCAEKVHISSLALLKMLKHGRAGVPMEVMGLMLGQFVDDYTINCVDVFAMPQSGTSVSVEAVDPVFQTKMLDMLKQTGRPGEFFLVGMSGKRSTFHCCNGVSSGLWSCISHRVFFALLSKKWWLDGITLTLDLVAGCRRLISIRRAPLKP